MKIVNFAPDHAEAVAQLFNECRHAWPWDFTDGIPYTADHVLTLMGERRALATLLAVAGGRPLGYLEMTPYPSESGAAYIQLVFVHPDHQGKGAGRRLLTAAVERTAALGLGRLDLHTWPSNLKAVPLYKKTGFFWVPGTQVWMQNYIPALLQNPVGRRFFERHDWYRCLKRELDSGPDDEQWHGMRSFTYRWRSGNHVLEAVIDREARGITAIATGGLSLACRVANHRPAAGTRVGITWSASCDDAVPLTVRGGPHIDASVDGSLDPGEGELSRDILIRPSASTVSDEEPGPSIESTFFVDGSAVTLTTGVRARDPLTIVTHPRLPVLAPGRTQAIHLGIVNPGSRRVRGQLHVAAGEGLEIDGPPEPFPFDLEPSGRAGFPLELTARSEGSVPIIWWAKLDLGDQELTTPPRRLAFPSVDSGVVSLDRDDRVLMVNRHVVVDVKKRGGTFTLTDRVTDQTVAWGADDRLGPPFHPGEFRIWTFEPEIEGATVSLTAQSPRRPDLSWTRDMTLEGNFLIIQNRFTWGSTQPLEVELQQAVGPEMGSGTITLPLASGLVRQRARSPEFPGRWRDLTIGPDGWAETWTACEHDGACLGVMWDRAREVEAEYITRVTRPVTALPGDGRVDQPLVIYLGPGDYRTVRHHWREMFGDGERQLPPPAPVLRLRAEGTRVGSPVLLKPDGKIGLVVENLRGRSLSGRLVLKAPAGWRVEPGEFDLRDVSAGLPARLDASIATGGQPRAGAVRARVGTTDGAEVLTLPAVEPGHGDRVDVHQDGDSWVVDNGLLGLQVAPGFFASLVSIRREGREQLLSAHPEPGEFAWLKPWFGGLHPVLPSRPFALPGSLADEEAAGAPTSVRGASGLSWKGVEVRFVLERAEDLRGGNLSVQYLTLPGSNMVAAVMTLNNSTSAPLEARPSFACFPSTAEGARLQVEESGRVHQRLPGASEAWLTADGWSAVTGDSDDLVIACSEPFPLIDIKDSPPMWGTMWDMKRRSLAPGESYRLVLYLVVADPGTAADYRCLSRAGGLL